MNQLPKLTDQELHGTLLNALATAAETYDTLAAKTRAEMLRVPGMAATHDGLPARFERQATDVRQLLEKLEEQSADA